MAVVLPLYRSKLQYRHLYKLILINKLYLGRKVNQAVSCTSCSENNLRLEYLTTNCKWIYLEKK